MMLDVKNVGGLTLITDGKEQEDQPSERGGGDDGPEGWFVESQKTDSGTPKGNSAERRQKTMGCVYFIESPDARYLKIGYTGGSIVDRFRQIGSLLPGLRLLGYIPGVMETERWLHSRFADNHHIGEWFRYDDQMRSIIANMGILPVPTSVVRYTRHPKPISAKIVRSVEPEPPLTASESVASSAKNPEAIGTTEMAKIPAFTEEQLEYFRKQGAKGGKIGGKARKAALSPERLSEIGKKAVAAREANRAKKKGRGQKAKTSD